MKFVSMYQSFFDASAFTRRTVSKQYYQLISQLPGSQRVLVHELWVRRARGAGADGVIERQR